jgi:hypothetical protein
MPQAGSPGGVSAQPETVGTSGRESAPNPLCELINIYDDEESLEVSLVTPVQIIEEKEPEKTSSPAPDAQIWGLPQNEQEVESVLDTELPDAPETQADSLKDEPGRDEQKEEAPWTRNRCLNGRLSSKYRAHPRCLNFNRYSTS